MHLVLITYRWLHHQFSGALYLVAAKPELQEYAAAGQWMQVAASLVPLQICRCEGNILCPMSDGRLLDMGGSADAEETLNIDNIARSISFGMYDAILEVVAVFYSLVHSRQSSWGKSYPVVLLSSCVQYCDSI